MVNTSAFITLLSVAPALAQAATVSSDLYSKFVRYAYFSGAAYADDCPTPPSGSSIVQFFNNTATDTQVTLFKDAKANELILSFRGTSTPNDLDTDFLFALVPLNTTGSSCSSCQVHQGFQDSYNSLASQIVASVKKAQAAAPLAKLTVTGHSLGGGLAAMASGSLPGNGIRNFDVYTFGEPRNGNPAYTTYVNGLVKNYYRVTHFNDGVPQIPPVSLGFQHHGVEYWESQQTNNSATTTQQCPGIEPQGCNAAQDFGVNPINGAHIYYSDIYLASALYNPGCGFRQP